MNRASHETFVSVIIPAYNSASTIIQAIESVFNQTVSAEVIVVDDGSTDDTRSVLASLIEQGKIIYLFQENRGCGAARNAGVQVARGTHFAFLDADDFFHKEKLERQLELCAHHPEHVMCYTDAYEVDPYGSIVWDVRQTTAGRLRQGRVLRHLAFRNFVTLSSCLVPREAFARVGGFEERRELMMFADYDLWLKLAAEGTFGAVDMPLMFYRTRAPIGRREKKSNHRKILAVFWNRLLEGKGAARIWYAVGVIVSSVKYVGHSVLLIMHL